MPQYASLDHLLNSFPKSNKEDWSQAASKEISKENPLEHLKWKTDDEIYFLPYYDPEDTVSLQYLQRFQRASVDSSTEARSWISLPKVSPGTIKNANAVALNHLANGADGILFDLTSSDDRDLDALLAEIHWPSCNVSFLVTDLENLIQHIARHTAKKNYNPQLLTGTIFCKSLRDINSNDLNETVSYKQLRTLGFYVPSSSPVKEISSALIHAATLMDTFIDSGFPKDLVWRHTGFSLASSKNFLLDIAKQKALRLLLYQIGNAFQLTQYTDVDINIRVEPYIDEKFQPHANMINAPIAAIAAIAGGCDSLTVLPENENNETMTRIARNVCNILREESHLNKVADPTAGAYAIENMVDALAIVAWKDFQRNVK